MVWWIYIEKSKNSKRKIGIFTIYGKILTSNTYKKKNYAYEYIYIVIRKTYGIIVKQNIDPHKIKYKIKNSIILKAHK